MLRQQENNSVAITHRPGVQQIAALLTAPAPDPSHTANALVQAALAGGGVDNVSAIVVQVG